MEEKQHKAATEDKQRIALLVKRVKELEAHAGKSVSIYSFIPSSTNSTPTAFLQILYKYK